MPTVPTYDQSQVSGGQDPTSFVQPGNAGEQWVQAGAALQGAGEDMGSIALDQQHLANADTVMKTEADFKDSYLKMQQSMQDRRGQNAWNVTNDVNDWFEKQAPKYNDSLENDAQRRAFAATFNSVRQQALESTGKFEAEQRRQSVEESGKDSIQASINIAAADHNNQSTIDGAKSDITKRVQLLATLNGWSPEIRDAQMTNALTDLHKQVIQALVDENPDQARAYYEANKQEIAGSEQDQIDKVIRIGTMADQSQKISTDILSRNSSESDALAEARRTTNGRTQDAVITRIKEQFAEQEQVRERSERQAADKGWQIFTQGGGYSAIPPTLLSQMNGETVKAIQDEAARRARGDNVVTDWPTFSELRLQAGEAPDQFAKVDLRTYLPKLAPAEFKQLTDIQAAIGKGGQKDVATFTQQLKAAHEMLRFGPSQKAQMGQFDSQAQEAVQEFEGSVGRKTTFDERQKIIEKLMQPGTTPGRLFGTNDSRYYLAQDAGKPFTPTMSDKDRATLIAGFKAKGLTPTEDQLNAAFRHWKGF